ncbi:MAG: hypothetical protein ACRCYD_05320 [Plesiomonas sp.]
MTKRESGWYRVKHKDTEWSEGGHELVEYVSERGCFLAPDNFCEMDSVHDDYFEYVDPQMVMTPEGEIVYHNAQHDPLYNTAQEQ